jgi:Flp pilus assembly protein TadG
MPRLRNRKGVTAVLVALMMIPLIGFTAIALDIAHWEAGANQLQTVADAAALAGARKLQRDPVNAATVVPATAKLIGEKNYSFGSLTPVQVTDVVPMFYDPDPASLTYADPAEQKASWADANAVGVTVRRTGGRMFAGVFNMPSPVVTRRAVAWAANINSGTCVKPWGLPYNALYDRVVQLTGLTSSAPIPAGGSRPPLSQQQILAIENIPAAERFIIFRPNRYDGTGTNPDSLGAGGNLGYNNGMYTAFNFTAQNNNAGGTTYQSNVSSCANINVTLGTNNTAMLPGNNDIQCLTIQAVMGSRANNCNSIPGNLQDPVTCTFASVTDARCIPPTSGAINSDTLTVAWVDQVSGNANGSNFRMLGKIKLTCMFRGGVGASSGNDIRAGETCSASSPATTGYPRATIIGTLMSLSAPTISPTTVLGNSTSDQQRLVLVRHQPE